MGPSGGCFCVRIGSAAGERIMPEIERALRATAREKINDATLPLAKPSRMWGGPGAGLKCVVCELHITKDQMELEVQFVREGIREGIADPAAFHFHIECFSAWELERKLLLRASTSS